MNATPYPVRMRRFAVWAIPAIIGVILFIAVPAPAQEAAQLGVPPLRDSVYVKQELSRYRPPTSSLPGLSESAIKQKYTGSPTEIAQAFVEDYKDLIFGIKGPEELADYSFAPPRVIEDKQFTSVVFDEIFKSVRVYHGNLAVWISHSGEIMRIYNNLRNITLEDVTPLFSADMAEDLIGRMIAPDTFTTDTTQWELCIYPSVPPRLAHQVIRRIGIWPWHFLIDAHSGELIRVRFLGSITRTSARHISKEPLRESDDSGDAASPSLYPDRRMMPLPNPEKRGLDTAYVPPPKKNVTPPPKPKKDSAKSKEAPADPQQDCWFFDVNFIPTADGDSDSFLGLAMIEWDADTWTGQTEEVTVAAYGWVEPNNEYLLFEFGPYIIEGYESDWWADFFSVPFKGAWTLELVLFDSEGVPVAVYPDELEPDSTMENVPMESPFEDLRYTLSNPNVYPGIDLDGDGFPRGDTLVMLIWVEPYDTNIQVGMSVRFYARDTTGNEIFVCETPIFHQYPGEEIWWYYLVHADRHGLWDFRLELLNEYREIVSHFPYELDEDIVDVPLERFIEDPPVSVVFDPNPLVALNQHPEVDIDTLVDHDDANYPALIMALYPRPLEGLNPPYYGHYYLVGSNVEISEVLGPPVEPAAVALEADGPYFPYYRSEPQFEQVMCYYHIDRTQRYLQSLGFANACNYPIEVDAHGLLDTLEGAYVGFSDGTGYLLFGDSGVDAAEDADIILHEYAHAVQNNQAPGIYLQGEGDRGYGNETLYMAEGFAMYWPASCTDSANQANGFSSAWLSEWVEKGVCPDCRWLYNIDNTKTYPESFVYWPHDNWDHQNSEVWGAALWDIFEMYGKTIADSLVLRAHELMSARQLIDPLFSVGAGLIVHADSLAYNADHVDGILEIFWERKISPMCYCNRWGDVNGDGATNVVDVITLVNFVYKNQDGRKPQPLNCPWEPGDVNCTGSVNVVDVVVAVNFVYKNLPWTLVDCIDLDGNSLTEDDIGCIEP